MKKQIALGLLALTISLKAFSQTPVRINEKATARHSPEKGSLIIVCGGGSTLKILSKF